MKRVYLASPFFNDEEREILTRAEDILRKKVLLYSPREHECRKEDEITPEWCEETFIKDVSSIDKCDVLVMLYHGMYSDSGTAWECGYACGQGKPVIVVHMGEDSNLMVHIPAKANISLDELEDYDFDALPEVKFNGKAF